MLNVLNPMKNELAEFKNMGTYIYNLVYMQQTKLVNIPSFICVPSDAIYYSLGEESKTSIWVILSELRNNQIDVNSASLKIREIINNVKLPKKYLYDLSLAINRDLGAKHGDSFILKTSVFWPVDNTNGLISNNNFGSRINVSYESIADAILFAYSSIYSPEILEYMKRTNFTVDFPKNNILIQVMLNVDISCTVSPVNTKDDIINERLIVARLGKNVIANEDEKIIEYYHYNTSDGQFFNDSLCEYELLNINQLQTIMQQANVIFEKLYKNYCVDIKFVVSNGQIYVLNINQNDFKKNELNFTIDGTFIPNNRRNASSDLTFSIINDYENRCIKDLFYNVYETPNLYEENKTNLDNLLVFYKNNLYYDTRRACAFVRMLPFAQNLYPMWEEKLRLHDYNYRIENTTSNLTVLKQKHKKVIRTLDKNINPIFATIEQAFVDFDSNYTQNLDLMKSRNLYELLLTAIAPNMAYKYANMAYMYNEVYELKQKLKKANIDDKTIQLIINDAMKPIDSPLQMKIQSIAAFVMNTPQLKNVLLEMRDIDKFYTYIKVDNDFTKQLKEFLFTYGDVTPYFNKIEAIAYNDNPCILINEILNKLSNMQQPTPVWDSTVTKTLAKKPIASHIAKIKELSKNKCAFDFYERILLSKLRKIFLNVGLLYKNENVLENEVDIIFFNLKEIFGGKNPKFQMLVHSRKEVYNLNSRIPTFEKIIFNRERN